MWEIPRDIAQLDPDQDGSIWLVRVARGKVHRLDEMSVLIWTFADGRSTYTAVAEALAHAFGWQPNEIAATVESFIEKLLSEGLLEQTTGRDA